MEQVGRTLWSEQAVNRELEQSLCRIRLCAVYDGSETLDNAATTCPGLFEQVSDFREADPSLVCSGFGFGPGTTRVCGSRDSTTGGSGSILSASMLLLTLVLMACVQ